MTGLVLFAGAGGSCLGLHRAGVDVLAAYDHDALAIQVRNAGLGDDRGLVADLAELPGAEIPRADLWWASPPCQPFSSAGSKAGSADDRDGYPWLLRLLDEAPRPGTLVIENVPGLTQHRTAEWMRKQGHAPCPARGGSQAQPSVCAGCYWDSVVGELERRFSYVEWRILDAADYGVPQHRRRVITICSSTRPATWPEPTHGPGRLPYVSMARALGLQHQIIGGGHNPSCPGDVRRLADLTHRPSTTIAAREAGSSGPFVTDRPLWWSRTSPADGPSRAIGTKANASILFRPAPSVMATEEKGSTISNRADGRPRINRASCALDIATSGARRRLTVQECAVLQGFPADWPFTGTKKAQYRQVGNAVPAPLVAAIVGAR